MAGYTPLRIAGNSTGLVQEREEFLLPDDAYPTLQNAYIFREKILRKKGYKLVGRLQRTFTVTTNITHAAGTFNINFSVINQPYASFAVGTVANPNTFSFGAPVNQVLTDVTGDGTLTIDVPGIITAGTINYKNLSISITISAPMAAVPLTVSAFYYPNLPVMGIKIRERQNSANDETIIFDQRFAYRYNSAINGFSEFIPGTTWNANGTGVDGSDFFWSTNYWVSDVTNFGSTNQKLFWVTNNTGQYLANADPIRITDGVVWVDFSPPNYGQIDATTFLLQALAMTPFRGRMLMFNTWEGTDYANMQNFTNRIRWSTIGNPFIPFSAGPPATGSWRDDIRGQGGFLDIPTSEDIISIGFVRDNLVIYCERSTWQLRYTGRSIAPFQIEKVNSELGTESPYSAVQFDTSLVGIGDKGIVQCDSYSSKRIDIKIPDFVDEINPVNNGVFRIQGIRDFPNRLAYWTIPLTSQYDPKIGVDNDIYPNIRLVYNYENDSWATFNDSLTALGLFAPTSNPRWIDIPDPWVECDFPWIQNLNEIQQIVGGNQHGFIEMLDRNTTNDPSLFIQAINSDGVTPTVITSPNHNLNTEFVIGISGIIGNSQYTSLNGGIFGVIVIDKDTFTLTTYNSLTQAFSDAVIKNPSTYLGGGVIDIRDNFNVISKKFNYLDQGQNIQIGYLDILLAATESSNPGAISMNMYLDYNASESSNSLPQNSIAGVVPPVPDTFFNTIIPTVHASANTTGGTKFWQRVFCPTRANFLTIEYTFNNAQMAGIEQELPVQIDAQILWLRKAGRMTQI